MDGIIVDSPLSVAVAQQSITNANNALSAASAAQTAATGAAEAAISAQEAASIAQSAAENAAESAEVAKQTAEGKQDAFAFDGDGTKFLNDAGEFTTPPSGGTAAAELLFFGVENGVPVATHTAPTEAQTIMPITHIPANPGVWTDVRTFNIDESLHGAEFDFIPETSFTAKFWVRSDMARTGALFRLRATNARTGESLAVGTSSVNLGQIGELQPIIIPGIYENPAVVHAEDIRMTLQVQSPLFGVQIGLFSVPPNEMSYLSRLISGAVEADTSRIDALETQTDALETRLDEHTSDTVIHITAGERVNLIRNKGFFPDAESLITAHPTPNDGDFAVVGSGAIAMVWAALNGIWSDTDTQGTVTMADLLAEIAEREALAEKQQSHEGNQNNPHEVTAKQIGALDKTGKAADSAKLGGELPLFYATQATANKLQVKLDLFPIYHIGDVSFVPPVVIDITNDGAFLREDGRGNHLLSHSPISNLPVITKIGA